MNKKWNLRLKSFLALNGITVKEAVRRTGINQSTFNSYMRGVRTPTEENRKKIFDELFKINPFFKLKIYEISLF